MLFKRTSNFKDVARVVVTGGLIIFMSILKKGYFSPNNEKFLLYWGEQTMRKRSIEILKSNNDKEQGFLFIHQKSNHFSPTIKTLFNSVSANNCEANYLLGNFNLNL
ncbi:hypothetical protein IEQ34_002365 [Dendrobium chrysotoxum]|uniref:Uncharacterized protein n=1 Tax=Dendrobium chrysotoxum TaxID=161865 RepID=A0AAV7HN84_DENCH|nr:hypothetical protein IEQ34_002365 [Dendrobium chrysotoxum]